MLVRIGNGYDVHQLTAGRPLLLGGVSIPYEKGLLGHSDADVLTHAIMDALLGAMGKGDIGQWFPDTDLSYLNISSILLLKKVKELLNQENYKVVNVDSIVVAQKPRLSAYTGDMKKNIAAALCIDQNCVNIKATTEEHLGFTGALEGIKAYAVCLIE